MFRCRFTPAADLPVRPRIRVEKSEKMEFILAFATIVGFVLAVVVLLFTEQCTELRSNIAYHIGRLTKQASAKVLSASHNIKHSQPHHEGDKSQFVRDLTIPDGTRVKVGQKFRKVWEIQNIGFVTWENRFLQRQGPRDGPGRLKSPDRIRIPFTLPGECAKIAVNLVAPELPGSCYAEWKMVDENGRILLPSQKPVYVSVDVIQ